MIASNYIKKIPNFPDETLKVYARLWEFERWLRRMVYVELRSLKGDSWSEGLRSVSEVLNEDKRFTHMKTSESNDLSFAQLWQLLELIDNNWRCFERYFPPKKIWRAKSQEVTQIRNRVAHFRDGHHHDLQRVEQLLKDVDGGFWEFCTSYNNLIPALPQSLDSVTEHFLEFDPLPWFEISPREWARIGTMDRSMVVGLEVNKSFRPWYKSAAAGKNGEGILYHFDLLSFARQFDFQRLIKNTQQLHQHFVSIECASTFDRVRFVLPSVLGTEKIIEIVSDMLRLARNAVNSYPKDYFASENSSSWPDCVLLPDDPMCFLDPDMRCNFFNL